MESAGEVRGAVPLWALARPEGTDGTAGATCAESLFP